MKSIVNEVFGIRRTNLYRYDEYKQADDCRVECWFVVFAALTITGTWAVWLVSLVRWAWIHWEVVKGFFGL